MIPGVTASGAAAGAAGAVTYVDTAVEDSGASASTTPNVPKPAGAADGDLLIAFYTNRLVTNFTPPAGWTSIGEIDATAFTCHAFYRFLQPGDPSSWAAASGNSSYGIAVSAFRGVDPTTPIGGVTTDLGNNNRPGVNTPNFYATDVLADDSMVVGFVGHNGTLNDHPAGTTEMWDLGSAAGGASSGNGWYVAADAGWSADYAETSVGSNDWATFLIALNPSGFVSTPPVGVHPIGAATVKAGSSATPTVHRPFYAAPGDLLIGVYQSRGQTNFTPPAGWTTFVEKDQAGGSDTTGTTTSVFTRVYQAGDPLTWTGAASTSRPYGCTVIAVRGQHATPITVHSTNGDTNATTLTYTGITVPSNDSLLIGAGTYVGTTIAPPASTSERWDHGTGTSGAEAGNGWTKQVDAGATGDFTSTSNHSLNSGWSTVLICVDPA